MMKPKQRTRNIGVLSGLILIGLVYILLISLHLPLTGTHQVDGILGVLIGLYACSHPAANALDIILFGRYLPPIGTSKKSYYLWWAFNAGVVVVGWYDIVMGLLRYSALR